MSVDEGRRKSLHKSIVPPVHLTNTNLNSIYIYIYISQGLLFVVVIVDLTLELSSKTPD